MNHGYFKLVLVWIIVHARIISIKIKWKVRIGHFTQIFTFLSLLKLTLDKIINLLNYILINTLNTLECIGKMSVSQRMNNKLEIGSRGLKLST